MRHPFLGLFCCAVIGLCAGAARGAVTVETADNGGRTIKANGYEAVVASDGALTNLRVDGQEFLKPDVSISRGTYFYRDGVGRVPTPKVEAGGSNTTVDIESTGDGVKVRYEFTDDAMTWKVSNTGTTGAIFFAIFDAAVNVAGGDGGKPVKLPVNEGWKESSWYRGGAKVTLANGNGVWGPWEEKFEVWQAMLAPGETRDITVKVGRVSPDEAKLIASVASGDVGTPADVEVYSPRELQVVQRTTKSHGTVQISGHVKPDAEGVDLRVTGTAADGAALEGEWQPAHYNAATHGFHLETTLPAGGWYQAQVRATKGGKPVAEATVKKFGVGEVFVIAGQSNSTNCGQERITQSSNMVSSFSGRDWRIGNDPQPGPHDKSGGGSPWPAFGDAMYAMYKVPIGIASTGHGGTSVNQWQPDGDLFNWMMGRVDQLGPQGFRAVLWHQGESDVGMPSEQYVQKLTNVIHGSRRSAGWDFPWFVAQVSYHNPEKPKHESTRTAHQQLWETGVAFEGPDTDTLTGDNRDNGGKGIHFSPKGLKVHGEMWAEKVGVYLDKQLASDVK